MTGMPLGPNPPRNYYSGSIDDKKPRQALAEARDLFYFRRPWFLSRWRLWFAAGAVLFGLAVLFLTSSLGRDKRVFQSRQVSIAHRRLNNDCTACHDGQVGAGARLLAGSDSVRSVSDSACVRCHAGPIHHQSQRGTLACAECHREHRGEPTLARVPGAHCTGCHANLALHDTKEGPLYRNVSAFAPADDDRRPTKGHPEFALWTGTPGDPGAVRFPHRTHLNRDGIPQSDPAHRRVLQCADCHEPDAGGRLMQPVLYERHCAICHPLRAPVSGTIVDARVVLAVKPLDAKVAPHPQPGETSTTVRADLRERYLEFARSHPDLIAGLETVLKDRAMPGRRPRTTPPSGTDWEWAGHQLAEAERLLFDGAQGCRLCHTEKARAAGQPPDYGKPQVPEVWLPRSSFRHSAHRDLNCLHCHPGATASAAAADVLMPRIETCMSCHNDRPDGARADCVECHRYHGRDKALARLPR